MELNYIKSASPIFIEGLKDQNNIQAGFAKAVQLDGDTVKDIQVYVTARSFYRLYVNGSIATHGPARSCTGDLRVDCIDVEAYVHEGENIFAFEVTSHGDPFASYSNELVLGPGLFACTIVSDGEILDKTDATWKGIHLTQRRQIAERISHCRQSAEIYDLDAAYESWRTNPELCTQQIEIQPWTDQLLPRGMALPSLKRVGNPYLVEYGSAYINREQEVPEQWFAVPHRAHYALLSERPSVEYLQTVETPLTAPAAVKFTKDCVLTAEKIPENTDVYLHYDFQESCVGFIGIEFETESDGIVDIVHLESYAYYDDKEDFPMGPNPVTRLHVTKGKTHFVTMEPALLRYIKIYFRGTGSFCLKDLYVLDDTYPDQGHGMFQCSDEDLNRLYMAARRTLKLNTLDIFMDCPERERGGWLCDSLWTARAMTQMCGDFSVERAFIENFLRTDSKNMWKGFFPECYPGMKINFKDFTGITTWSFWLMEELCEFVIRSGYMDFAKKYEQRVADFVAGSQTIIGPSGLLENLPWLFIDWSLSNDEAFKQPISTAANALYSKMLIDLGELYGRTEWVRKGNEIRDILRNAILTSGRKDFLSAHAFPDALIYKDGILQPGNYYSESAQYLMVWSGLFDEPSIPQDVRHKIDKMFFRIVNHMGTAPKYASSPHVGGASLFIGLCIRMDMLAKLHEYDTLYADMKAIYMPQLKEGPGTLWESCNIKTTSRCHGFTAHAGVHLTRDILGLGIPDELHKTIKIAPHPCDLRWARGVVKTSDGLISLFWTNKNGAPECRLSMPDGWTAIYE